MASHLKLLVRAWLPGRGCCHLRSPEMTEAEARSLLDVARGAIERAQESGGIEEVPRTKDRAFVMARRSPDPDHPDRTAPGFVLVSIPDPDAFFRAAVADQLRAVEVPAVSDAALEDWVFLDLGATPSEAEGGSGHGSRTASWLGVASRLFHTRRVRYAGIVLVIIVLLIAFWRSSLFRPPSGGDGPRTPPMVGPAGLPGAMEIERKRDLDQIAKLLREPWVKKILNSPYLNDGSPGTAKNLNDRQILANFSRLFRRPRLSLDSQDECDDFKRVSAREHPFVAFLNRLPEKPPELPGGDASLSAAQAMEYLGELKRLLNKDLHLNLDFDGAEGIAQPIKLALDYEHFYEEWSTENRLSLRNGSLDKGREEDGTHQWVGKVRKVIEVYSH